MREIDRGRRHFSPRKPSRELGAGYPFHPDPGVFEVLGRSGIDLGTCLAFLGVVGRPGSAGVMPMASRPYDRGLLILLVTRYPGGKHTACCQVKRPATNHRGPEKLSWLTRRFLPSTINTSIGRQALGRGDINFRPGLDTLASKKGDGHHCANCTRRSPYPTVVPAAKPSRKRRESLP